MQQISYDQLLHDFTGKGILKHVANEVSFNMEVMEELRNGMIRSVELNPKDDIETHFLAACTAIVVLKFNLNGNESNISGEELLLIHEYVSFLVFCINELTKFFDKTPVNLDKTIKIWREMLE